MTINDKFGIDKSSGLRHSNRMNETAAADPSTMPIAIVGMSCRFPGDATDPNKLWDLCQSGRNAWSKIPESRFDGEAWYHPDRDHVGTVRSPMF
jgi:acyl transferase domain-containing protein